MTAAFLPAVLFGLGLNAGPAAGSAVYVPGDWPFAHITGRVSKASVASRSVARTVAPRSTVATASQRE